MQNTTFDRLTAEEKQDVVQKCANMINPIPRNSKDSKHLVVAKPEGSPKKHRIQVHLVPSEGKVLCNLSRRLIYQISA
jgi:hypothetical protein